MPLVASSDIGCLETCNSQVNVVAAEGTVSLVMDRRGIFTVLDLTPLEADMLIWLLDRAARRLEESPGGGESGTPRGGA